MAFRASAVGRAATAIALLRAPGAVEQLIAPPQKEAPTAVARLLGARLLAQSVLEYARPTRNVAVAGLAVDVVHAGSMVLIATADPQYRRVALASALVAVSAATVSSSVMGQLRDGRDTRATGGRQSRAARAC